MSRIVSFTTLASGFLACALLVLFPFSWSLLGQDRCVGRARVASECASYVVSQARATTEPAKAPPSSKRAGAVVTFDKSWRDNPSLMDSSWRAWLSLTDF